MVIGKYMKDSPSEPTVRPLLSPEQAANILGVRTETLACWRSTGRYKLPFIKVGRWIKYREEDVMAFISDRTKTQVD